ncbi:MAG: hypothetical protein QOF72_1940, partial [Blastocatellia bacterium]|nr:hypothetical protein [Blastocatellia bacterium]
NDAGLAWLFLFYRGAVLFIVWTWYVGQP